MPRTFAGFRERLPRILGSYPRQRDWCEGVSYLGRFETLEADLSRIADKLGAQAPLPHENVSIHAPYREFYDEASRDLVSVALADEIERFGYTF